MNHFSFTNARTCIIHAYQYFIALYPFCLFALTKTLLDTFDMGDIDCE